MFSPQSGNLFINSKMLLKATNSSRLWSGNCIFFSSSVIFTECRCIIYPFRYSSMRKRAQAWGLASIWKRWFTRPMLSWWRGREKMLQAFGNWRAVECGRLSSILMHERNVSDVTGFIIIIYFHASPSADDLFSKIWSPVMVSRKRWWWWKRSTPVA